MSSENVELARRFAEHVADDEFVAAMNDEASVDEARAALAPCVEPGFEVESKVVFTFRDEKLVRLELHLDRERAMKAAGLAE